MKMSDYFVSRRALIVYRILIASVGGYVLTNSLSVLIALLMPTNTANATLIVMLLNYVLYALLIIWAFSVKSVTKLSLYMGLTIVITSSLDYALLLGQGSL